MDSAGDLRSRKIAQVRRTLMWIVARILALAPRRTRVSALVPRAELSPGSFSRSIRKITGIAGFHAHQMRHTFACQWLERGGSLADLQQILGHASIVTTQRYARLTDEIVMAERLRMGRRDDQEPTKTAGSTT
jgi:integrase